MKIFFVKINYSYQLLDVLTFPCYKKTDDVSMQQTMSTLFTFNQL